MTFFTDFTELLEGQYMDPSMFVWVTVAIVFFIQTVSPNKCIVFMFTYLTIYEMRVKMSGF